MTAVLEGPTHTSEYVGLHNHSERSFLDGEAKIAAMAKRVHILGQSALSLNDHQEVNGHIELQKQCGIYNIKPIFGMEGYFHPEASRAKELKLKTPDFSHITLLAQNNTGLRNLWSWSTRAYTENFYYRALVDWDLMAEYSEGIYASDGCLMSHMAKAIVEDNTNAQHELISRYLNTFGDRFFMELHTWQFFEPKDAREKQLNDDMGKVNRRKVELAQQYSVPLVVVNDAHYASPEDWERHALVWNMNTHGGSDQEPSGQTAAWLMDDRELLYWMGKHGVSEAVTRQAIANSARIAADCNAEIVPQLRMPRLAESPLEDIRMFVDRLENGFKRKVIDGGLPEGPYRARMEREARIICQKDFAGYFNVVSDYIRHAKYDLGMFIGPGRGSAGGSLCAWLMDITEMDPLKYDLLFERFISEDRVGLPDIDTDFPKSRLHEVKTYLATQFGQDKVCQMGTLTRSAPKSVINDLGRAFGVSIPESKSISSAIGQLKANTTYDEMMEQRGKELETWTQRYPEMFQRAREMTGMVRQSSTHASGFIVSSEPLLGILPMRYKQGVASVAFEMDEVEYLGFVKLDLLGLRHCDTIAHCLELIQKRHGKKIDPYTFGDTEFKDPAIWTSVGEGDCLGLFQLDAALMTQTAKRLKPESEEEVAELLAINRPGVIDAGLLTPYIERKHGREPISFDHPMMEELVGDTHGIIIYQEQMMKMSRKIAGFTPTEAENLRKIVGKKQVEKLPALREQFFDGCRANQEFMDQCTSDPTKVIERIWTSVEASGSYLFNKCVTGDTQVALGGKGSGKGYLTIEEMWRRLHDLAPIGEAVPGEPCRFGCDKAAAPKGRGQCKSCVAWRGKFKTAGLTAMSLCDDGKIRPKRIADVHYNGVRPVWKITLADGRSITSTANHRHAVMGGYCRTDELLLGDTLCVMGDTVANAIKYDYAFSKPEDRTREYVPGSGVGNKGFLSGEGNPSFTNGGFRSFMDWTVQQESWTCSVTGCTRSKTVGDRIERAHLNGDRTDNRPENLRMMCVSHHKQHDYRFNNRNKRFDVGRPLVWTEIISIEPAGAQPTYDLEMADDPHNWVGNGIVTHNSHSIAYALIASWEAWLKHYYYPEFITATLATDDDDDSTPRYIRHARQHELKVLPPDINVSESRFTLGMDDDDIRYGLTTVRGVGENAYKEILEKRPFTSFENMLDTVTKSKVNKGVVLNLCHIGAFDVFNPDRVEVEQNYYEAMKVKEKDQKPIPDYSNVLEMYRLEKHLIGSSIMYDPMAEYEDMVENLCVLEPELLDHLEKNDVANVGGLITKLTKTSVKRGPNAGAPMAFLDITFRQRLFSIVCFSEAYIANKMFLELDAPVIARVIKTDRGVHLGAIQRLDFL